MRPRVLVAQPSATLQRLIRMTLAGAELFVECVGDGHAALEAAALAPPDVLVADAALAGLDGYSLAEALRADPATVDVPVLLIVPDYERPDRDRMMAAGIRESLTRPFEQHDLLERVRGLVRSSAASPTPPPGRTAGPSMDDSARAPNPANPAAPAAPAAPATVEAHAALIRQAVADMVPALVADAVAAALERVLPEALDAATKSLGDDARVALEAAAGQAVDGLVADHVDAVVRPRLETVVWEVVPELAEDLIRQEIRRLTEDTKEGDA